MHGYNGVAGRCESVDLWAVFVFAVSRRLLGFSKSNEVKKSCLIAPETVWNRYIYCEEHAGRTSSGAATVAGPRGSLTDADELLINAALTTTSGSSAQAIPRVLQ